MRTLFDRLTALFVGLLPRRVWDNWNLPVANVAFGSALLTFLAGFAIGIPGYFAYLDRLYTGEQGLSILEISKRQVSGELPETAAVSALPAAAGMLLPISFALFSPLGLFATYLVVTGLFRVATWYIGEPHGDPMLTGIDALAKRLTQSRRQRTTRVARERLEGMDEPDRRYDGEWAGLTGVDFVVVSARRKLDWTRGTVVITDDGWFTLGEPFDRPMPQGLRTVYPLTLQTTPDVLRKGVAYQLPPLRPAPPRRTPPNAETPKASRES